MKPNRCCGSKLARRAALLHLALAVAASLGACNRTAAAQADEPSDPHAQLARPLHDVTTLPPPAVTPAGPRYRTTGTPYDGVLAGDPHSGRFIAQRDPDGAYGEGPVRLRDHRVGRVNPGFLFLVGLIVVGLLVRLGRRRPPAAGFTTPQAGVASRPVVALACGRCSRVVDVPRDRLARGIFCPRCGSRMPGE